MVNWSGLNCGGESKTLPAMLIRTRRIGIILGRRLPSFRVKVLEPAKSRFENHPFYAWLDRIPRMSR